MWLSPLPRSSAAYRRSVRKDLLPGILGADLVGFQTAKAKARYAWIHYQYGSGGQSKRRHQERGRFVDVGVFPMGIDVKQLHVRK